MADKNKIISEINRYTVMNKFVWCVFGFALFFAGGGYAQSKVPVPEVYWGFWEIQGERNKTDGLEIGGDYMVYGFQVWYIDNLEERGDTACFRLRNNRGGKQDLRVVKQRGGAIVFQPGKQRWREGQRSISLPVTTVLAPEQYPAYLYKEWAKEGGSDVFCRFYDTDKFYYEGQEWRILRLGNCRDLEYRFLAKSGDLYKAVYIQKPSPRSCVIASEVTDEQSVRAVAAYEGVYRVLGNWLESGNQEWKIGFFEDFAIYKNDFWDYRGFDWEKNRASVKLARGDEQVELWLDSRGDSVFFLTEGRGKKVVCRLWDGLCPVYATRDTSSFKDSGYVPDTVTVNGYLRCGGNVFDCSVWDFFLNNNRYYEVAVDSLGRFRLRFPLLNTMNVLEIGVVEPGENLCLYWNDCDGRELYMGDNGRLHNEQMTSSHAGYRGFDASVASQNHADFVREVRAWYEEQMANLGAYRASHPFVSDRLVYFWEKELLSRLSSDLGQRRFLLGEKEVFSPEYLAFWKECIWALSVPYTLVAYNNSDALSDYMGYWIPYGVSNQEVVDELKAWESEGMISFSGEEGKIVKDFEELLRIQGSLDSTLMREQAECCKRFEKLVNRVGGLELMFTTWLGKKVYQQDSLPASLVEFIVSLNYSQIIKKLRIPLNQRMLRDFSARVTILGFRDAVLELDARCRAIEKEDIDNPGSLKSGTVLAENTSGDSLLRQLTESYRGKVIYLDFWGTWCGPCKEQMKYMGGVKKALEGKDVVFMYLANHSDQKSWENVIKEYHLTGDQSVHYNLPAVQQELIERALSVGSFPTFMLVDKAGRLVNTHAPKPEEKEALLREITRLLEE